MGDWITKDGRCFGCGQANESGLRLRYRRTGEGSVEAEYTVPEHFRGAEGVVHGGIQATLLDEVMGLAVHSMLADVDHKIVTAELNVRYRKATPTEVPLVIRGSLVRVDGTNLFISGEIVDARRRGPDRSRRALASPALTPQQRIIGCAARADLAPRPSRSSGISGSAPCPIGHDPHRSARGRVAMPWSASTVRSFAACAEVSRYAHGGGSRICDGSGGSLSAPPKYTGALRRVALARLAARRARSSPSTISSSCSRVNRSVSRSARVCVATRRRLTAALLESLVGGRAHVDLRLDQDPDRVPQSGGVAQDALVFVAGRLRARPGRRPRRGRIRRRCSRRARPPLRCSRSRASSTARGPAGRR